MSFNLIDNHLSPSEGEVVVRTYHCTYLSPIFALVGLKTDGYLTVTNKRVVYYAEGSSGFGITGNSKLYTEVSMADVSNLSFGKGTRFSLLRLLCGLVFGPLFAGAVAGLLSGVMLLLKMATGGGNPYLLRFCVFAQLATAACFVFRSFSTSRENIFRLLFATSALSLVLSLPALGLGYGGAWQLLPPIYLAGTVLLSIPLAGYWLWCLYWFVRREYITMAIASKTGMVTPIKIVGVSWWGRINVVADLASGMAPGVDAETMFKELGAVVSDIQTLGDHGVEKWMQNKPAWPDGAIPQTGSPYMHQALVAILAIGAIVGGESTWHLIAGKRAGTLRAEAAMKADALRIESEKAAHLSSLWKELADAKSVAEDSPEVREWVPKMWALAEQNASACETASNSYDEAVLCLREAIDGYARLPDAAAAMENASKVQSKFSALMEGMYVQESATVRLKDGALMSDFTVLMNQHPGSNDYWKTVVLGVGRAKLNAGQEKWGPAKTAWEYAGDRLPPAIQLMRADLWVDLAKKAIKEGDAPGAFECAENALKESASHPDAEQRKQLAGNMMRYSKLINDAIASGTINAKTRAEFMAQLDVVGGADGAAIKRMSEKAMVFAERNEWEKCNSEWKSALEKLPLVILAMQKDKVISDLAAQMDKVELEARRGNWAMVSVLAGKVLAIQPGHQRAKDLKEKADSIEGAMASQRAYEQALSNALVRENSSRHIKMGDMSDFNVLLDRYGHEEWAEVKETVRRAEILGNDEHGSESSNEWAKACAQLQSAVQRMRAEVWMEQAEREAKSNNWAKVVVYSENALKEKPGHVRARELRDQADGIEEMKDLRLKYNQLFKSAADQIGDIGGKAGDQDSLTTNLVRYAGTTWENVIPLIAKANEYEAQGNRAECVAQWASVFTAFPLAVHEMRAGYWVEKAENEAKSNLWAKASLYVDNALKEVPDHVRAKKIRDQIDQVEEIIALQNKYEQMMRKAADEMPAMGGAAGDREGLLANLAKYGGASWASVAGNVKKAATLDKQGKRAESIVAWEEGIKAFPVAMSKTHAGYWVDKAENDAKSQLWGKVSIEAEKALAKDPENERAKALKAEADKNSK